MKKPGSSTRGRLGDQLVQAGAAPRDRVEAAAKAARATGQLLGEALVAGEVAKERDVYRALADQAGLAFGDAESLLATVDTALAGSIPRRFLEGQRVVPVRREGTKVLAATCDPRGDHPELAAALGAKDAELVLVTPTDFRRIRMVVDLAQATQAAHRTQAKGPTGVVDVRDLLSMDGQDQAHLVALFEAILLDAIGERASDIHLERYGPKVRVRLRIDGDLHDVQHYQLSPDQLQGLVNVLKVSAQLDISERRMPQGGRFRTQAGGHAFDLRVQTQPSLHGEHAVVRLLPQDQKLLTVEELGFDAGLAKVYLRLLDSPNGLVLVVGPTGSGKSTTLYAGLQILARDPSRKVISVEDPIEYGIDGVQQTQARPELGFAFAQAMRAFVREDPDVILVGEIRDGETALEAMRASQTGHLVFSTLHCNDAVDAVQRLFDLGLHPNTVASELLAVFAQRLAKRICPHCRVEAEPSAELLAEVFPRGPPADFRSFKGAGCPRCHGLGTFGRVAVLEYLPASARLRRAISERLQVDALRALARECGWVPMKHRALQLVAEGVVHFEELRALLSPEQLAMA